MDYLKTIAVAILDCKQNLRFIVFCKVVFLQKEYIILAVNLPAQKMPQQKCHLESMYVSCIFVFS